MWCFVLKKHHSKLFMHSVRKILRTIVIYFPLIYFALMRHSSSGLFLYTFRMRSGLEARVSSKISSPCLFFALYNIHETATGRRTSVAYFCINGVFTLMRTEMK